MKKITALLLCFLLLCMCSVTAFAAQPEEETVASVISSTVPDTHKITVIAEEAKVLYEGVSGEEFIVGRLSEPRLLIRAESGKVIKSVMLNGEDVTSLIYGGYLNLAPVYEDKELTVTTENEPTPPKDTFTIKGKVTLNGEPLADVDLELRSTLKTTKTDKKGSFIFSDVEQGKHSITALKDGNVIGYMSFDLKKDKKVDVVLLEDGTFSISVNKDDAGVELHLVLNEEEGTLTPIKAVTVPHTGDNMNPFLWLILALSAACIVVLATYRRNKKFN